ncbi:MAG TPA: DUF2190 family protein, partial [Burkholderiaceae bacterium]|nr:DUF2190 family protein [Burkholderiaceae bacterium]
MALGPLTYKTPNQITTIAADLTGSEGCGVRLSSQGTVALATAQTSIPYGIVVVGAASVDGTYPGQIAAGSLEIVDAVGCVVQVLAGSGAITVGTLLQVDGSGSFVASTPAVGEYVWGVALTAAPAGGQFLMRFLPYITQA